MADKNKQILRVTILSAIFLIIVIQFTQTIGLISKGFDSQEVLTQYFFYAAPAIGYIVALLLLFFVALRITKDDKYGNSQSFASQGEFPAIPFWKRFTTIQLAFIWLILFGIAGLFSVITKQQTFTGLALLPQQFSPLSSTVFSAALVVISENMGAYLTIAFLHFLLRYVAIKINLGRANYAIIAYIFFPIVVGLVGLGNHLLRYSGSDTALLVVFLFWYIGGLITVAIGSAIPFIFMHVSNNVFIDLARFFDSDTVITGAIITIVAFIIIYSLIYRKRLLGKPGD